MLEILKTASQILVSSILSLKALLNQMKQPENWWNMMDCGHTVDSFIC